MSGVEILATSEVAIAYGFYWLGFWILVGTGILLGIVYGFVYAGEGDMQTLIVSIALIAGIIGGLFVGVFANDRPPTEYETQYKVTISDEVSMNDFLERYEILDQEGKIYTVREVGVEDG